MKLKNRGTTIIELLVAMVIIAITTVASLEFFNFCQRNFVVSSRLKFVAANIARETMEETYWLSGASLSDTPTPPPNIDLPADCGLNTAAYYRDISTENALGGTDPRYNYKLVEVTIKDWT